ncbi:hypothetical protein HHK36_025881 [Tetracentron sinense]|uniref:GH18 domain-containing protein n=1 Tax=Tetracentron sinense TaxID=13715 RepID=A0A835D3I8_TETSI|nr:hypothetical protein HHK36_025881 [Tetracentron sinense]
MASKNLLLLFFSLLFLLHLRSSAGQTVVKGGYWFRASEFPVSDINSTLFTHLFCAFADLDSQTYQVTISSANAVPFKNFTKTVQIKNPSLKTLLSIGGGSSNPATFASMANQSTSRKAFIDSSIKLARANGFSGLDLDWEYPGTSSEMANMGTLFDEWRVAVAAESRNSSLPPLLLTAAVNYAPRVNSVSYPTTSIGRSLDWVNVMAYDYYAPSYPRSRSATGAHAALYDPSSQVSTSFGISSWNQTGLSSKKLVLGLPFYGYAWQLVNPQNHGLYAPANGPVGSGDGSMGYNQIKDFIVTNSAVSVYNATIVADYCYAGSTWIGFDDSQTIVTKVSYAKQKGLLGYFAWHVGVDNNWVLSKNG